MGHTESSPFVDRIILWSINQPLSPAARYMAATLLIVAVAALRAAFITSLLPFLFFMPVTLLIGLTMGRRTGLYAVLLSGVAAPLTLVDPTSDFLLTPQQWIANLLYVAVSAAIVFVAAELRKAFLRARRQTSEQAEANALLKEKEEQLQLLNHELGHRLKNLLAIVQAVASQTLRQAPDLPTASDALSFRLAAFGRAADVLTATSWESADLHTLAMGALATHESLASRFRMDGPVIRLNAQVALAMALAFHELVTNAIKYGALSNETGHVDLSWRVEPGANSLQPRLRLRWQEVGGPPVRPPSRRGFGSMMIERSLRAYFRGTVSTSYKPDGLVLQIDAPLVAAEAEGNEQ